MNDFDFSFMILRRVNEKCDEFWMKNSEKLVKIIPFYWENAYRSANVS